MQLPATAMEELLGVVLELALKSLKRFSNLDTNYEEFDRKLK